jgi:hypothetical protein
VNEDIPTYVAIPFLGKLDMTIALVNKLLDYDGNISRVFLLDNGPLKADYIHNWEKLEVDSKHRFSIEHVDMHGKTLTEMWNEAWRRVMGRAPVANLAILNNDIKVQAESVTALAEALRSNDKWWAVCPDHPGKDRVPNQPEGEIREVHTVGIPRDYAPLGGMCGWAFMVRTETAAPMPIDEQFHWWCGDNEVVASIEAWGHKVGLVQGLSCEHLVSATLNERIAELQPEIDQDLKRYEAKRGW